MFRTLTTVLFALALVVSYGLKLPQNGVSSMGSSNVTGITFSNVSSVVDQHIHRNASISQCLDIQLVFDIKATVRESTRLNKRYFDCPNPEPGVPCFYYKDPVTPIFSIKRNGSEEMERFMGSYTFKVIGGGPFSRSNIRYYNQTEIMAINSFSYSMRVQERTMWRLPNLLETGHFTKEGFVIMSGSDNFVGFVCRKNSPCGDLIPPGLRSPEFFFIVEVSNEGVDNSTDCVLSTRFELHVHGLPLLPERALLCLGLTMFAIFGLFGIYEVYNISRPKACEEQDSLSEDEELEPIDVWTRLKKIHDVAYNFTQEPLFNLFIKSVVLFDTILMVVQGFPYMLVRGGWVYAALDACFLGVYLMELLLQLSVLGYTYFRNSWNVMDFLITFLSVVHFVLPLLEFTRIFQPPKLMKAARAIRGFRLLKIMRSLEGIQVLLTTAVQSLLPIASISFLMMTILILFTVLLRVLFAETVPESFGTFARTISTLFQVLTLDDWAVVYEIGYSKGAPYIMVPLVLYIAIENFILLSIILAVLVDNLEVIIKKTNQREDDMQEEEEDFIRKTELEIGETRPEEESYEEIFKNRFSGQKHGERKAALMAEYLRVLARIEQSQVSSQAETFLLKKLVEIGCKEVREVTHS